MDQPVDEPLVELEVDPNTRSIMDEIVRWSRFLAVLGITGVSCMILFLVFADSGVLKSIVSQYIQNEGAYLEIVVVATVIVVSVLGLMVSLLYRFSSLIKRGLETGDQGCFNSGWNALKVYFIIGGVFALLTLFGNIVKLIKL